MSLTKKYRLGDNSISHGFDSSERGFDSIEHTSDTSEHAFNTEVLTPYNTTRLRLTGETLITQLCEKERILILASGTHHRRSKRSFKTITTKEHYVFNGNKYLINSRVSGCYTEILKSLITQTLAMESLYKRVLFMRFDLNQGIYTPTNKRMTTLLKRLRKRLIHRYGQTKFGYLWVREESSKNQHYHFVFMMDGDLVRYPSKIHDQVKIIWESMGGTFHFSRHHFIDSEEKLREAILHGSYLAKPRTKGNRPDQTKDYSSSRLRIVSK